MFKKNPRKIGGINKENFQSINQDQFLGYFLFVEGTIKKVNNSLFN